MTRFAREAVRIFDAAQTRIEGLFDVEIRFDVSTPTARNLVNRGRYLRDNKEGPPMTDPILTNVYVWQNGMVMAFDQHGQQMPDYQGRKEDVWEKIQRDRTPLTKIEGDTVPLEWNGTSPALDDQRQFRHR